VSKAIGFLLGFFILKSRPVPLDRELAVFGQLVHAQDRDSILKIFVALPRLLSRAPSAAWVGVNRRYLGRVPNRVPSRWLISACFACAIGLASRTAAQADFADHRASLADGWLDDALHEQSRLDTFGRYVAAPAAVLLGGSAIAGAAVTDSVGSSASFIAAGGLMLTAAAGQWANSDPAAAQRWYARTSSLGFVALGVGLMLLPSRCDPQCDASHRLAERATFATGAADVGLFMSFFLLSVLLPPPSASALHLQLRGQDPSDRYGAVLDFLKQRERIRRIGAYVATPWLLGLGITTLVLAPDAATSGGRAVVYGMGIGLLALSTFALVYELLRTPDWRRLEAGYGPQD
jgi:hypothetical protein